MSGVIRLPGIGIPKTSPLVPLALNLRYPRTGQAGPNPDDQDEGQAGPNPDEQNEGQAGPNPGEAAASQPLPSPVVHAGPNLEHIDLEVTDVSTQAHPEQMDEGFTATAYPKVQENLKLIVIEHMILEEPVSSTGTLSSLQHLTKDLSFGDPFFNDKPSKADNEKTTAETEAESMVSVTIQQDTSANSSHDNTDIDWAIQAPLWNCFRDLPEADVKEILHKRMWETNSYKTHEDHMMLYEALEKSMNRYHYDELLKDLAEARKKKKKRRDSPKTPPGSPSHQPPLPPPPADLQMDDDMAPDAQAQSSDDEDNGNAHIPKASALASTYSPPPEDSLLAKTSDMAMFIDWFCKRQGITELKPQDLEGPAFELVKVFHPNSISKMKAAYYPDVGLEHMVPDQMWIEEECKYDIVAMYEDFQIGIECYQTQLNLTKPRWDATGFEYKHDYTVIDSPRAVTFQDRYGVQMIMRFNEIHKFSDGTLHQINEALDYWVKEFKVNRMNPGLNTRFWTRKDVDRSKEFMFAIQKRLKTRRIFCNLESFIGGRVKDGDYRLLKHTKLSHHLDNIGSPICAKLFRISMHILRRSKWCVMAIVEIPKTDPAITLLEL
nr:hypothetical protein [Tanacetum cinerariifolium]